MTRELVDRPELAIESILRYQTELRDDARLAGLMKSAHTWFAARSDDGAWLFAPSKFVGYAANTADDYLAGRGERDERDTERVLRRWFALVPPETALTAELGASLARFVGGYGHSGPRKGARIGVLKEVLASGEDAALSKPRERICPRAWSAGSAQGAIRRTTSMRSVSARLPMTKSNPEPGRWTRLSGRRMPTSPPGRSGPRGCRWSGCAWATRPVLRFEPSCPRNCRPSKPLSPAGSS